MKPQRGIVYGSLKKHVSVENGKTQPRIKVETRKNPHSHTLWAAVILGICQRRETIYRSNRVCGVDAIAVYKRKADAVELSLGEQGGGPAL